MTRFLDVVKYRRVALCSTKDIVECCFIVQNSLSYLNLELCEFCVSHEFGYRTLSYHSGPEYDDGFVCTEEKCRKKFDPDRYLMYRLHLDIPKERYINLKQGPGPEKLIPSFEQFPIGKLTVCKDYYPYILSRFVEYMFEYIHIGHKLRITVWLLRLDAVKEFEFGLLSAEVTNYFIDLLYPKFVDSELMKQFLLKCNFGDWIEGYERPKVLEDLLHRAHRYGRRRMETDHAHDHALVNLCIFQRAFVNVGPLLKYRHAPSFCSSIYNIYLNVLFMHYGKYLNLTKEILFKPESWMGKQRYCLLIQILLIYFTQASNPPTASEALRLLWSTYTHSYITLEEIRRAFGEALEPELIDDIYEFYVKSVEEVADVVQPRSLKHICRLKIRKTLWMNKNWLPEGIARTGLPSKLQAYLNLKKVEKYRVTTVGGKSALLQIEDRKQSVG